MFKITLITLISAGVVGTSAHTISPEAVELNTGPVMLEMGVDGFIVKASEKPDFAISLRTKNHQKFSIRL